MHEEHSWQSFPHIVRWVSEMQTWANDFGIYEYIDADEGGADPTGKLDQADPNTIWTELLLSDELIVSGYRTGDWGSGGVVGWYVGEVSHGGTELNFDAGKFACSVCEGRLTFKTASGEELDCEPCAIGDSQFIRLSDTDFSLKK